MSHHVLRFKDSVKIVHFIGATKPWHHPYNTATKEVTPLPETGHNKDYLQIWWDIFMSFVQPTLDPSLVSTSAPVLLPVTWHYLQPIICSFRECWFVSMKLISEFYASKFCLSVHDCELSFALNYERFVLTNACCIFFATCASDTWQMLICFLLVLFFIKVELAKDSVETKTLYMYENEDNSFKNKMKLYL